MGFLMGRVRLGTTHLHLQVCPLHPILDFTHSNTTTPLTLMQSRFPLPFLSTFCITTLSRIAGEEPDRLLWYLSSTPSLSMMEEKETQLKLSQTLY